MEPQSEQMNEEEPKSPAESEALAVRHASPFAGIKKHRSSREAADAGLILWRRNFAVFLLFFALPFWIIAFSIRIILPGNLQYLCWFFIWLLKPLFDRVILHIISIRFFDSGADFKRLFHGLGKNLCRGLAGDLLWRRFSPLRTAVMPVRMLERNLKSGKDIAQRKQILKEGGIDFCFLLTIWAVAVEIALLAGQIIFFITIAELFAPGMVSAIENLLDVEIFFYGAWCFNFMLVETIYVCMGFTLYINSRVEVEGWDIEIKFHDFAQKLLSRGKSFVIAAALSAFLFVPVKSFAEDNAHAASSPPLEQLQTILDSPDFGSVEESWGIRFKDRPQDDDFPDINSELIERVQKISAYILQFLLIGVIAGLIVFLIIYLRKHKWSGTVKQKNSTFKTVFDNYTEDPKLLLEKALSFHEQGNMRLSWGYCTAAAIKSWTYRGIAFPPDATESDCAMIINSLDIDSSNPPLSAESSAKIFDRLVKNWVQLAYAGRLPPDESFKEAVEFVRAQNG